MKLLLDTHLLLWAADEIERLPAEARSLIDDGENKLIFSVASIWEIAIKSSRPRPDFLANPSLVRRALLDSGYAELEITGEHAIAVAGLPPIHGDPFDRLMIAQATVEGIELLTNDKTVARYPGPIRKV